MYGWVVFLHVLGAFLFVAAHGSSMVISFRLRGQRDRAAISELLQASQIGVGIMYLGLLVLLGGGILAGFMGGHWGRLWIWAALVVLVVVMAVMYTVATPFYGRMRLAAGLGDQRQAQRYRPPVTPGDLDQLAASNRPFWLAVFGGIGLLVILWLMLFKPF